MKFLINEESIDDIVVLYLKKNEYDGEVEIWAQHGKLASILLTIKTSGGFSRIGFVRLPYFKLNEEGQIEEEEL